MIHHIPDLLYFLLCDINGFYNIFLNGEPKVAPPPN